jgi:type IV fimbrial biogenesis protein FimT
MASHARIAPAGQGGFSLVELITVVAIAAVLAAGAAVGLSEIGRAMTLSAHVNRLLSEIYLARSEAIKRNSRVVLCKSADGVTCASSGGWEQGWIVFHDANNNALRDPGELLIRRGEPATRPLRITGNDTVSRYVSFSPFGGARLVSGAFQAGTITICRESLEPGEARQLVINSIGRPRVQRVSLPSCD